MASRKPGLRIVAEIGAAMQIVMPPAGCHHRPIYKDQRKESVRVFTKHTTTLIIAGKSRTKGTHGTTE